MAQKRIERLTEVQEQQLAVWREKWLRIGLATGPSDRPRAEDAVRRAYAEAKLPPPRIVIWLRSPLEGCIGAAFLCALADDRLGKAKAPKVWDQVRDQVRAQVGAQVWDQVRDQVWDQVGDQVRAQVGAQVGAQVWDQVGAQVWDQVGDQVWDQVGDQVWDQVGDQVNRCGYGLHDANWLAFYEYFDKVCGLVEAQRLKPLNDLAESAGWWWPFAGAAILTDRPVRLERDDRHRLHCLTGAAVEYPDGWGVYAVHGVRIPSGWITAPGTLTPQVALTHRNVEQRRAACEILGWSKILAAVGAKTIDADPDPEIGILLRADLPDAPGSQFLRVRCGTGREFTLPVPGDVKTARAANAWTYGLTPTQYKPEVRT